MKQRWTANKIEMVPVDDLIPYARNARRHPPDQIAKLAGMIAEYGFTSPLLVGADNVLIAGHGRVEAARKAGLTKVPVIRVDHLSNAQRKALIIADNKSALDAEWDTDLLALEFEDLREMDFDLDMTGFDADEIAGMLDGDDDGGSDTDPDSSTKEIDPDSFEMGHRCPRCGFEFDDKQD